MFTNIWQNMFILKTNITYVLIMFWSLYLILWHVLPHLVSQQPSAVVGIYSFFR